MQLELGPLWSSCMAARGITGQTGNAMLGSFKEIGLISTHCEYGQLGSKFIPEHFLSFLWNAACTRR